MTATKLLTFQMLCHGLMALTLLLLPKFAIRLVGLPSAENTFWPRLLGAVLLGVALAALATLAGWTKPGAEGGMGLAAEIIVNLGVAFVLLSMLFLGPKQPTVRGSIFSGALAVWMILLALIEMAYV